MTAKSDEPLSTIRQLELMRDLQRLANERHQAEAQIEQSYAEGMRNAEQDRDSTARKIESHFNAAREASRATYEATRAEAQRAYEQQRDAAQQQYKGLRQEVETEHSETLRKAVTEQQEGSWETLAVFDAIKGRPRERLLDTLRRVRASSQQLAVFEHEAATILKMRRQWRDFPSVESELRTGHAEDQSNAPPSRSAQTVEAAIAKVDQLSAAVRDAVVVLYRQRLPRLFEGGAPAGLLFLAWILTAIPSLLLLGWQTWWWLPVSAALALALSAGLAFWLYPRSRTQSGEQFRVIQQLLVEARQAVNGAVDAAHERGRRDAQAMITQRDQELTAMQHKFRSALEEKDRWKETEMSQAGSVFPSRLAELRDRLERELSTAEAKYNSTLADLAHERDQKINDNQRRYDDRFRELRTANDSAWESLADRWFGGYDAIRGAWANMKSQCARWFPDWETTDYRNWPHSGGSPAAIAFGNVTLDLANVKHGMPQDPRLKPPRTISDLPALMNLKEHPTMVITAEEEGRRAAIDVLQLMMLRFLTGMPPGKVRFTILDPIGLGESFASFMHLADFDEQLIAGRIWTESKQIDEQLSRLTAHMETVLQKYLRNQFATIDDYNEAAGEVAEPFHVLVVANFPANFSEAAARKLISIISSGPRCGVYTLVGIDRRQKLPNEIHLDDLLATAVNLDWQSAERRFRWRYPAFEHLPLTLDRPPSAERFNDVVRAAGLAAKNSLRVEVPFETVTPDKDEVWQSDSGKEFIVPVGRAGAMRLQSVRLGKGTSQHLLVCGKTGSGKSTFLHGLITNAALHFSPDQVEFYLIDFKKGVEFKTYATHRLPHARVIAIESEREFGLSVLERLDGELRRRGELFRADGVQDVPGYRAANPGKPMPRVLLIIDEFQELFVEDDKLSQDASLLLDRLVRQGRAFGMHVLLGSQTLSGAYSLPRSTMGQMAVRVALQCSEADAHLILSDERNNAARYLSRPGEAIYNDQNGLVTGNQPFQVVWLSESQRVDYLREVEDFAAAHHVVTPPAIVFEGDQPAEPGENAQLVAALANPSDTPASPLLRAWLGAAVAIKEATFATFARQAGNNMLVVGSEEESALGVLSNAVIALAAQNSVTGDTAARFIVLDGTRPDAPDAGTWQRVAAALPQLVTVVGPRDVARVINEVATELASREAASREDAPPIFLVVFNAGRFRDLRRSDDFSFSVDRDKPAQPDKQWNEILRSGPAWGVHSLVWCDSYNDVNRLVDRQTIREFEMRIVFQMSAADSTNLLDSPAAAKLRQHRGLFYSDDLGTTEKFRPFGPPSEEWLQQVREAFAARAAM